jgi:hypothetical protein
MINLNQSINHTLRELVVLAREQVEDFLFSATMVNSTTPNQIYIYVCIIFLLQNF